MRVGFAFLRSLISVSSMCKEFVTIIEMASVILKMVQRNVLGNFILDINICKQSSCNSREKYQRMLISRKKNIIIIKIRN